MKLNFIGSIVIITIIYELLGCSSAKQPKPTSPIPSPPIVEERHKESDVYYASLPPSEGSLWSDSSSEMLFIDQRARRVGDTVIIDIVENSSSKLDANTTVNKSSSVGAGVPNFFGLMRAAEAIRPNLNRDSKGKLVDTLVKANYGTDFKGKASSDRSGQITASVGARVVEVLPNGNLVIYGRREIKVNNESQFITVSGVVRSIDVTQDNRVQSISLSDAKIEYSGNGVISDKQKVGWLTRIMDNIWPF
ncbi:MAG: flagellar basal body L-ring protein FlgH [Desulfobacterales bacterium]|nr:flagellar basal body L-ring protein FlgH [Desulfobacterales bacterium]